jgi:hypothetical protein
MKQKRRDDVIRSLLLVATLVPTGVSFAANSESSSGNYFVRASNQNVGPLSGKQIRDEYQKRKISDETYVWGPDLGSWTQIKNTSLIPSELRESRRPANTTPTPPLFPGESIPTAQEIESSIDSDPKGWDNMRWAFLVGASSSLGWTGVTPEGSTSENTLSTSRTELSMSLLYPVTPSFWIGPDLGYSMIGEGSEVSTYTLTSTTTGFTPGLEARFVIPSANSDYFAFSGRVGYSVLNTKVEAEDSLDPEYNSTTEVTGGGFAFGASIAFGKRLGGPKPFLAETFVRFSSVGLNADASNGTTSSEVKLQNTSIQVGISIGLGSD